MAGTAFNQTDFRGRNNDGSETSASFIAALNTNWSQGSGSPFRVRFRVLQAGATGVATGMTLFYSRNGGAFTVVSGSSSVLKAVSSAVVSDGTATTQQIGSGTFLAGSVDTVDGAFASTNIPATQNSEFEGCLQIVTADVTPGDTIQIRLEQTGGVVFTTYTNTPTLTVAAPFNISSVYKRPLGPNYRR